MNRFDGNDGRRWLRSAVFVFGIMLLIILISPASAAVWTDKEDYQPGEVVTISGDNSDGAGYLPGETIIVDVQGPNGYKAACSAVADDQGVWSCQVTLWEDETAVGEYTYTATGQSSGVSQRDHFIDSAGYYHFCWLKAGGTVWCAGRNEYGQLGVDPNMLSGSDLPMSVDTLGNNVVQISGGFGYNCALNANGGVWCWGFNKYGQLGNGSQVSTHVPVFVSALGYDVVQISAGHLHACALKVDGSAWCWGRNNFGQLGIGSLGNSDVPVQVSSLGYDWAQISAGNEHTCALKTEGSAWCWGRNNYGQLGIDSDEDKNVPEFVSTLGSNVSQIDAGAFEHTCARKSDGSAWCWGRNHVGQLGNGSNTSYYDPGVKTPVAVISVGNQVARVLVIGTHSCAIMTGGGVQCWGYNFDGQLGRGYFQPWYPWPPGQSTPDYVGNDENKLDTGVTQISGAGGGTCALLEDGSVQCWGHNGYNHFGLGYGASWRISLPTFVSALGHDVIALPENCENLPVANAGGPYNGNEGSSINLDGSNSTDDHLIVMYEWDCENDGVYDYSSPNPTGFSCFFDESGTYIVSLRVTDDESLTDVDTTNVIVANVAPTGDFTNLSGYVIQGETALLAFSNQFDPSSADTTVGFLYSYDCTNDGTFEVASITDSSFDCLYPDAGKFTARGRIVDKDGDFTDYTVLFTVLTPEEATQDLIDFVETLNLQQGIVNSFDAKLESAVKALEDLNQNNDVAAINSLYAFINAVEAQRGKSLTDAQSDELINKTQSIIDSISG
jgi:alpha-tubulin suppressor-like RCC1 family protein